MTLARDTAMRVPLRGFHTTAADAARLAAALMNDGVIDGERVLPEGVAASLLEARADVPFSTTRVGYGVRITRASGRRAISVSGGGRGHGVSMQLLPAERLAVIVLTNKTGVGLGGVADFVFARLLGDPPGPPRAERPPPDPASLQRLAAVHVADAELVVRLSVYKGFAFVVATAVLLYLLLRRSMTTIDRAFVALEREEAERVRQEERRRRAEAIVASTDDAIISKAPDGTITSLNPAAQLMFGYSESEVVGQPIDLLIPPEALNDEPLSGERVRQHETTRMRKDGALLPVAITFSPI